MRLFLLRCKLSMDKSVSKKAVTSVWRLLRSTNDVLCLCKCSSTARKENTMSWNAPPVHPRPCLGLPVSGSSLWPHCFSQICILNILAAFDVGQCCENQCTLSSVNIPDWLIKHVSERWLGDRLHTTRSHWYVEGVRLRNKVKQSSCGLLDRETDRTVANWSADWWEVFLRATGVKRLGRNPE